MASVKTFFPPDERHLYMLMGTLFTRLHASLDDADLDGLRKSQLRVLQGVPVEGVSVTELAERVGMTKQGVGQFVAGLSESGHLVVDPDPVDARVRRVHRTSAGDAVVRRFTALVRDLEDGLAAQVGERRYRTFRRVLEEMALPDRG